MARQFCVVGAGISLPRGPPLASPLRNLGILPDFDRRLSAQLPLEPRLSELEARHYARKSPHFALPAPLHGPRVKSGRSGGDAVTIPKRRYLRASCSTRLFQIILLQKLRPKLLWRRLSIRPSLWREVHQVPVRPHRVDMVRHGFRCPEMKNPAVAFCERMHHRKLLVVVLALAFVVRLKRRPVPGQQRNLRPAALPGPCVDFFRLRFGDRGKRGVLRERIPDSVEPIHQRRAGWAGLVPARAEHP